MKNLAWNEPLGILRVHEVHLQNIDHLTKRDFASLKFSETSSRRKEKKSSSKALQVNMAKSNGSDNSFGDSTNAEVALMSRKFKQMMKKKGKFQHSSRRKDNE